jgi:hypothetical protein
VLQVADDQPEHVSVGVGVGVGEVTVWVPETCATWSDAPVTPGLLGSALPAGVWGDFRLVGLKLIA